ncbi:MAG: phage head-tail connector protein [Streptosporangiaceae bacterium]
MALGDSYATLADLKSRLRITDTTDDDDLTNALSVASRGIEHCTNRQFNDAGAVSSRVFVVGSSRAVRVDDFSTAVGLVVETGSGYTTMWDVADYELWPLNGIVGGVPGWPYWRIGAVGSFFASCGGRARVTAQWGWAAVPSPVREGCLILAEDLFKLRDSPFGAGGYGEYGRIRARENPNVWMRIAPYRRDVVLVG